MLLLVTVKKSQLLVMYTILNVSASQYLSLLEKMQCVFKNLLKSAVIRPSGKI